jgi:hypothetical protein
MQAQPCPPSWIGCIPSVVDIVRHFPILDVSKRRADYSIHTSGSLSIGARTTGWIRTRGKPRDHGYGHVPRDGMSMEF